MKLKIEENRNLIDYLKAIAIILVVFGHAMSYFVHQYGGQLNTLEHWICDFT